MTLVKAPVLWSLSNNSGALFQKPLFAALNIGGQAYAICSPVSTAKASFEKDKKLLAAPPVLTSAASVGSFFWGGHKAKSRIKRALRCTAQLVHVTMPSPLDAYYLSAAKSAGVPAIITIHDNARHLGEENPLLDLIDEWSVRHADHIVTLSDFVFEEVRRKYRHKPVHLVANGLLTRDQIGLPPRTAMHQPPRILFLGRIHPYKGLDLLLDSLDIAEMSGVRCELTIAGSGDLSPYTTALARRPSTKINNGWIDDEAILNLLRSHDILALPYLEASQSGVAIDAQWAAMPAIATPVGALPQQFSAGEDALICNAVTPEAFAECLVALTANPPLFQQLSQGAALSYKDKDLVMVANRWRDFYHSIL